MSATERVPTRLEPVELSEYPRFELSYLYDDGDAPAEVTVFPATDEFDISTNWITVDVDSAIPLADVR